MNILIRLFKLILLGLFFFSGCISIVWNQFLFYIWYRISGDEEQFQRLLQSSKKVFIVLLTFCTSKFSSPTNIVLSFRNKEEFNKFVKFNKKGQFDSLDLDPNTVVIANHQIYSDWFFIWFLAYLNNCSSNFFIVMKDSLKKLPILGTGMKNYNFVFLSRNWEKDRKYMHEQFRTIKSISNKFWMLIFPEGTNMSHRNREKSNNFAKKLNYTKTDCVLLPRIKGLFVACKELAPSTTKILDFTIGYSGHGKDEMAQDIFTLWKIYILGESPKTVSILVDEHDLKHLVPELDLSGSTQLLALETPEEESEEMEALNKWINKQWLIKENDMMDYYANGEFNVPDDCKVVIPLELASSWEVITVYTPSLAILFAVGIVLVARTLV
jgi:1-acyl-sn-glycerol-3-phosphate acyltransferase